MLKRFSIFLFLVLSLAACTSNDDPQVQSSDKVTEPNQEKLPPTPRTAIEINQEFRSAVSLNNLEQVKKLIQEGADVNYCPTDQDPSALNVAIVNHNVEMVGILLSVPGIQASNIPPNDSLDQKDKIEKVASRSDQLINVMSIPEEPRVISEVEFPKYFSEELTNLVAYVRDPKKFYSKPRLRVSELEAKQYFQSQLSTLLTEKEKEQGWLERLLSAEFVGQGQKQTAPTDPQAIYKQDPYIGTALFNSIKGEDRESRIRYFERERKRFQPATLLLSPQDVWNCFLTIERDWLAEKLRNDPSGENRAKYKEAIDEIFSHKYFGVPKDPVARKEHFIKNDVGFLDHELIGNIYLGSKRILQKTKQGDALVIFGNTPYFIGRTLGRLISTDPAHPNFRKLVQFPFSGTPNGVRQNNFPDMRNLVTAERLSHLQKRMASAGLSSENRDLLKNDTYFIDVIASGAGPAYVMEELLRDFKKAGLPYPNLRVITMNKIDINREDDTRNKLIAKENADDLGHTRLFFPSFQNAHFSVDSEEVYIPGHGRLDMLPSDDYRGFPEYQAFYWQSEFDHLVTADYSWTMKIILEYFDTNIENLISTETKKVEIRRLLEAHGVK